MVDNAPAFDLLNRDVVALLAVAEYLELLGQSRAATLARSISFSLEQNISDVRDGVVRRRRIIAIKRKRSRKKRARLRTKA